MSTRPCLSLWFLCFRFDALTELGAFMWTESLCISVFRVASGPRVKLASCKNALNPRWFILLTVLRRWSRCWSYSLLLCSLFYERFVWCLTLCYFVLVFFSPFSIAITSLGKIELILVLFVRLFDLRLFGFVSFLFVLVSGKGCGLWLWRSLDISPTFVWTFDLKLMKWFKSPWRRVTIYKSHPESILLEQ